MRDEEAALLRAADAVASGAPVDWPALRAEGMVAKRLDRLRLIESIRDAHRETLTDSEPEGAKPEAPLPFTRWGPFEVFERIGAGRFGDVYRATDVRLDKDVALKLLGVRVNAAADENASLKEARQQARVSHPNVLLIHGVDRHEGRVGLWSELIEGRTLEELLEESGPFSAAEATSIGIVLCQALAAVNAAGLVHGDVKTTNVMREVGGRIVLMDFSSVRDSDASREEGGGGTPAYMAPEVFAGGAAPSVRSDLYSLGVLLYRLVSGQYPVRALSVLELHLKHRRGEVIPLRDVRPDLPPAFVRVVERALAADPTRRYASAGEMERALVLQAEPASRAKRWKTIGLAATVAAALALVTLWFVARDPHAGVPFQAELRLLRIRDGHETLLPWEGGTIQQGDSLELEIEPSATVHVYIVATDGGNKQVALFPSPGLDARNPLSGGRLHRIPGTARGEPTQWGIDDVVGIETYSVVASREPLPASELALAGMHQLGSASAAPLDPERLRGLRGPELVGAAKPAKPFTQVVEAEAAERSGVRSWVFVLDHVPPPQVAGASTGVSGAGSRKQ